MEEIKIKNMVCPRCVMAVEAIAKELGLDYKEVILGSLVLSFPVSPSEEAMLEARLKAIGFEILRENDAVIIEKIKTFLISIVQHADIPPRFSLTETIHAHLSEDYSKLSSLFSSMEGQTIERYFIQLKIDKVKEWLFYGEYQLSEMAWKLGYSSVQHLSSQFKKVTGMTPTAFKKTHTL
jgi:AraC family transcriptional regulator